jgi:hypothetical protein
MKNTRVMCLHTKEKSLEDLSLAVLRGINPAVNLDIELLASGTVR